LGITLAFVAAVSWVFGKTAWDQMDSKDPSKLFAYEVFTTVRATIPHFAQNGAGKVAGAEKSRSWFSRRGREAAEK
jgi:hypothetical protein